MRNRVYVACGTHEWLSQECVLVKSRNVVDDHVAIFQEEAISLLCLYQNGGLSQ